MKGLTVLQGHARFTGPHTLRGRRRGADAPKIFLNVGGRASVPDMPGVNDVDYLTNTSILKLDTLPEHLVIVGGSYIGLEFAQMYRRFGAEVTIVEKGPRLIAREDEDISDDHPRHPARPRASPCAPAPSASRFAPGARRRRGAGRLHPGRAEEIGSHVLLAVGRQPNTDDLGLDKAGVAVDARGYITVDDSCAPMCRASGRWATATAAALSPIPPTTISRSSPPICWTALHARSMTACTATRSTSIRRWAGSA